MLELAGEDKPGGGSLERGERIQFREREAQEKEAGNGWLLGLRVFIPL